MANSSKSCTSCGNACSLVFFGTMLIIAGTVNDAVPLNIIGWCCLIAAAVVFYNYRTKEERLRRQEEAAALLEKHRRAIRESEESPIEIQAPRGQQGISIFPIDQVQLPGRIDDPSLLEPLEAGPLEFEDVAGEPPGEPVQLLPTSAPPPVAPSEPVQLPPDVLQPPEPAEPLVSVLAPAKPVSYQASPMPAVATGAPASRFGQPAGGIPVVKAEPLAPPVKPQPPALHSKPEPLAKPKPLAKPEPKPLAAPPTSPLSERIAGHAMQASASGGGGFSYQPKMVNSRFGKPADQESASKPPDSPAGR